MSFLPAFEPPEDKDLVVVAFLPMHEPPKCNPKL